MITVDDLKAPGLWKFKAHADGSGFTVDMYECEVAGVTLRGERRTDRATKAVTATYAAGTDFTCHSLELLAGYLNQRFTAGDDTQARDD